MLLVQRPAQQRLKLLVSYAYLLLSIFFQVLVNGYLLVSLYSKVLFVFVLWTPDE